MCDEVKTPFQCHVEILQNMRDSLMAGLTIRGPYTNVLRGPFLIRVARIFSRGAERL